MRVLQEVEENIRNGIPAVIRMLDKQSQEGHAVLAVGVDGNAIVVNDSNDPNYLHRILINGSTWQYSCAGLQYSSSNTYLSYYVGYTNIYQCLTTCKICFTEQFSVGTFLYIHQYMKAKRTCHRFL